MDYKSILNEIALKLGFEVSPADKTEEQKQAEEKAAEDEAKRLADEKAEADAALAEKVEVPVEPVQGDEGDEDPKETAKSVKKIRQKMEEQEGEIETKLSAQKEEIATLKQAVEDLVKVVQFLSEQPTDTATEQPKDSFKNFVSNKKASALEKMAAAFEANKENKN